MGKRLQQPIRGKLPDEGIWATVFVKLTPTYTSKRTEEGLKKSKQGSRKIGVCLQQVRGQEEEGKSGRTVIDCMQIHRGGLWKNVCLERGRQKTTVSQSETWESTRFLFGSGMKLSGATCRLHKMQSSKQEALDNLRAWTITFSYYIKHKKDPILTHNKRAMSSN